MEREKRALITSRLFEKKMNIFKSTILFFLILSGVFLTISATIQHNLLSLDRQEVLNQNRYVLDMVKTAMNARLSRILSDVMFIRDSFELAYPMIEDEPIRELLLRQWCVFSEDKGIYDQMRFLDLDGNEVFRVNQTEGQAEIVPKDQLQNKANRYYFQDSVNLPENQIYVSCMDLNVENGQIEDPIKPSIRFATPVFDETHNRQGVVVLNYLGDDLLSRVRKFLTNNIGDFYLLNADGYWLLDSGDPTRAWGFMYPDRTEVTFQQAYPEAWETIRGEGSGTTITKNGVFLFDRVLTSNSFQADIPDTLLFGSGEWTLVSRIRPESAEGQLVMFSSWYVLGSALRNNWYVYGMILLISLALALLMEMNRIEQETVRFYSEYDAMTGMLNRRAGLEKLNGMLRNSKREPGCHMSICFMDINGLKEINDSLGHEMGDELIRTVSHVMRGSIRDQDLAARLGGDEFLIVFIGLEEAQCEEIWQRITERLEEINRKENRDYVISVSHGIETLRCRSGYTIDSIMNSADTKMYAEKRRIKENLKVVRKMPVAPNAEEAPAPQPDNPDHEPA